MFHLPKWGKFGDIHAEKKVTLSWFLNSNMTNPEKFDHLHLVYHLAVPLNSISDEWFYAICWSSF